MHRAAASLILAMATAAFAQQPAAFEVTTVRVNHGNFALTFERPPRDPEGSWLADIQSALQKRADRAPSEK